MNKCKSITSMNRINNILAIATITALLLIGTSVIPMQSYAGGSDQQQKRLDKFIVIM